MTSALTNSTVEFVAARSVDALTSGVGVLLIGALLVLLIEREFLRQIEPSRIPPFPSPFGVAIAPLLIAFVVIVTARFLQLS